MTMTGTVEVQWTKWGGALHYGYALDRLGQDDHGVWLASVRGRPIFKGGALWGPQQGTTVLLVPQGSWWTARYGPGDYVYVDVATPAVWEGDTVHIVDLDLDVVRSRDGVSIADADEFDENRAALGYPDHVAESARRTAEELAAAVRDRVEPFGIAARRWLAARRTP